MQAVGIDLGGTKIETQIFDESWTVISHRRSATPQYYPDLLSCIAADIAWAQDQSDTPPPVGIAAPGLVHPDTGHVLAANLCANGHPLPADLIQSTGTAITYLNDGRAQGLSEARFGAGRSHCRVTSLILGTGVGGGLTVDGALLDSPRGFAGEYGHTAAPAALIAAHDLPIWPCGCGRLGCIETYIAGPGLERLALHMTGETATTPQIAARKTAHMAPVWLVWCALVADLLRNVALALDPDIIVLGGGLSKIEGVAKDLTDALAVTQIGTFPMPKVILAEGGETSGARGAAYAAWQAQVPQ